MGRFAITLALAVRHGYYPRNPRPTHTGGFPGTSLGGRSEERPYAPLVRSRDHSRAAVVRFRSPRRPRPRRKSPQEGRIVSGADDRVPGAARSSRPGLPVPSRT